jgi:hypothetical protein
MLLKPSVVCRKQYVLNNEDDEYGSANCCCYMVHSSLVLFSLSFISVALIVTDGDG